uniref:Carn_acyltransf domain-containing protein n=1 Tax=Haemonchus contortus TaxID=6289 RepID=A0A7I4YTH5_HAECO
MANGKVPSEGHDLVKKFSRKANRITHSVADSVFPFLPHELIYAVIICTVLDVFGFPLFVVPVRTLENLAGYVLHPSPLLHLSCVLVIAAVFVVITVYVIRFAITLLLYYKGWLFESVGGKPSTQTQLFMAIMQLLSRRARFFSFQGLLPWMPPPSVKNTVRTYLKTVRPLLNDTEFEKMTSQAEEFEKTVSKDIQRKLWLKWLISKNYLSDWWKEVVYMRHRGSLIHTNVACADIIYQPTTTNQAARAAYVTLNRQYFCRDIFTKNTMKPISMGPIPLCATQYIDYHRSLRVPRETSDVMIRLPDARHIAVYSKKCWYKVNIFHGKRMIRPAELQRSLQQILDQNDVPHEGEEHLSALTAGSRDLWARIRDSKFSEGVNKESLSMIENALEIVFLDDGETGYDQDDPKVYDREYQLALTGDGYKLWCDKPSVYTFTRNGRFISNAEHSVVDAMIYVHVREYLKYHEAFTKPYGPDGNCVGDIQVVPKPERLRWNLDDETVSAIKEAYTFSKGVADDFENAHCVFRDYGKDFMKKIGVSPDAYLQMALQMAYYKDQGKFELTYEPTVMRLFRDGRTETVRSCSIHSCDFVNSMLDETKDDQTRLLLLRKACDSHQTYYRNAMAGYGVDRHLFGMYVVSKYYGIQSPFLDNVFSMSYALSTSQTPQHQMSEYMKALNKERDLFWPAGAFSCPEGSNYGVCYTIGATGDIMSFHVTSWKSLPHTDARRFCDTLRECLREMKTMVDRAVR